MAGFISQGIAPRENEMLNKYFYILDQVKDFNSGDMSETTFALTHDSTNALLIIVSDCIALVTLAYSGTPGVYHNIQITYLSGDSTYFTLTNLNNGKFQLKSNITWKVTTIISQVPLQII